MFIILKCILVKNLKQPDFHNIFTNYKVELDLKSHLKVFIVKHSETNNQSVQYAKPTPININKLLRI